MLSFSPERSIICQKCASFCWNVEYVRSCWMPFPKKVLLSAEKLNMLNMLNYFGSIWSLLAFHRPKIIQHDSTYSTFQQKEAYFFSKIGSNMIQHIQHFSRKKHIWYTCWIIFHEITTFGAMLNFFPWKNHFLGHVEFSPQKEAFFQKCASFCWNVEYVRSCWMPFPKKVLLSAEMLNMLNTLNYFGSIWSLLAFHRPKIIQHIQHIQHFQQKEAHFFENWIQHDSTYSTFQQKEAHLIHMLKYFPWSNHFLGYVELFSLKEPHFWKKKKMLLSAEMLNMLNYFTSSGPVGFA